MITNLLKNLNIDNNIPLIVGCSAGPDSMALLHYLKNNTNNTIICAHINHNVRKESKTEEEYLKKYCKYNNITFESMTIKNYNNKNFENQAREKRYKFYEEILQKYNSKYLFLAHHGDDLIETILMKIVRGSNIEGYAGIKKISHINNYYIIRPFLEYTKQDLINYNQKNNIKYFTDNTNFDTTYTRNRYRKNILPLLKKENKNVHKQFLKYSETLQEYNNYIDYEVNNYLEKVFVNNYLDLNIFTSLHPFIQKNILYKLLNNIYNNKDNIIKEKNIKDILNLINSSKPNMSINLAKNKIVIKEYTKLYIKEKKEISNNNNSKKYKILLDKNITINNITIKQIDKTDKDGNDICRINSKQIKLPLYIRNKEDGDYIEVLGLNGHKKVKEILIENKVPKSIRDSYPLLIDANNNIIWIPNLKKSKFNSKKDEFCDIILKCTVKKEENNE